MPCLLVGLGPLPGLQATVIYGGGVTGTAAYWISDVARTLIALLAGFKAFNGV